MPHPTRAPLTVRVDVDTQHGFCHREGGLYVSGAEQVLPAVARLNEDAMARGMPLVGSVDSHDFASVEFRENGGPWPVHCVRGTWDWLKPAETLPRRSRFVGREAADAWALGDGARTALYFEKDAYSLFQNENATRYLEALATRLERPLRFEVYGVALDYCVRAAALALRERGHEVAIVEDAVRGVAPDTMAAAWAELERAGVTRTAVAAALAPAVVGNAGGKEG